MMVKKKPLKVGLGLVVYWFVLASIFDPTARCCNPGTVKPWYSRLVQDVWSSFAALGSYVRSACASSTFVPP